MSIQNITKTIAISLSLSVASGSLALAQSSPESIIEGWVKSAQGYDFLKVSHDGIVHDTSSNITTISGLSVQFVFDGAKMEAQLGSQKAKAEGKLDYKISFPAISFDSLSFNDGYYSARSIHADIADLKMDIIDTPSTSSMAEGTYRDFNFSNVKWARMPEISEAPDKPISRYYSLIESLIDISFDSASLAGMSMRQSTGDPAINMNLSYGAMSMGKAVHGNFSNMVMDGITMVMQSPNGPGSPDVNMSSGSITISGYDYMSVVKNFAPGTRAMSDNAPFKTIIGEMAMNDLKVGSSEGSFSMSRFSVSDIGVRPARVDILQEVDQLYLNSQAGGKDPDSKKIIELVGGAYGALRLGNFEFSGIKFAAPGQGQGKLDLYRINDLSANGLGEFVLKGINFVGGKGEYLNMDLFSLANITFPPLDALINLEEATKKNDVLAIMKAIPTLGSYRMNGLEARIPGEGNVSVAESSMDMSGFIGPVPTRVDIAVRDAKMPVKMMDREPREVLNAMGFTDVQISYGISALWDEATKVISLNSSAMLTDGAALDADVSFGGIPRSVFENPLTAQSLIALVTVNSANILFDDQSIVDKGLAIAAAKQGVDPATLKAQAVGMLPFVLQVLNKPEFVTQVSEAVKTFLDSKGKIAASATPASPISVMQLIAVGSSNPGAVIDLLNVKVAAE